jgi:IS1 family transposase/lambda repressor-like predicted transcriptional regulator
MVKAGFYGRDRVQRWKCQQCGKRFGEPQERPFGQDSRLPVETIERIIHCLVEGNSVRSTSRLCDVEKRTVLNVLKLVGEKCERIMGKLLVNVPVKDVQCDEIWGYVYKKEAHKLPAEANDHSIGDAYCFVAIERYSKLVLNFALGRRDQATTDAFIEGLRAATANQRFQITTDGFQPYKSSIETTLGDRVDYAMLIKTYAQPEEEQRRYSPPEVVDAKPVVIIGNPDKDNICTSHIERQNLSIRMGMRRMTRLTNAFSKKWENLWAAYCLWFAYYNFCRVHRTLRVTPAMEAGITDRIWDLSALLEAA